ncbi:MAG: hypothetical protein H0W30_07990 [Gemmatimonadaceae bacterium]|nr:hypothetical protein [Gemmatimonadaceae bacterium]MDQ3518503.1 hypothetical protein [Gemmatimonadota bacterium]
MFLERRTVSRKTPVDGKLEISKEAAQWLSSLRSPLMLDCGGTRAPGMLATMACTCRGAENPHEHHFVESQVLKTLATGAEVDLNLDGRDGVLCITRAG